VPVPLLYEHGASPIGTVTFMSKTPRAVSISAVLYNNNAGADLAWRMFESGEMDGLSCGFAENDAHILAVIDGVRFYNRWTIKEVSVTRNPKNDDCHFKFYEEEG
jgi:hypothetical protein